MCRPRFFSCPQRVVHHAGAHDSPSNRDDDTSADDGRGNNDDSDRGRDDDKPDAGPLECVDTDVDRLLDLPACLIDS